MEWIIDILKNGCALFLLYTIVKVLKPTIEPIDEEITE
jgi:hypothetical protein